MSKPNNSSCPTPCIKCKIVFPLLEAEKTEKTWNVEVFVQSIHEMNNTINWKEIIFELDHQNFIVSVFINHHHKTQICISLQLSFGFSFSV